MIEPDVLELDAVRGDAEMLGERSLDVDGDVAQADGSMAGVDERLRDDPDRVREVDDPGTGCASPPGELGELEDQRNGPERLGEASR